MKRHLVFGVWALLFGSVAEYKAQRHEVGVRLGMANLVGDIGKTNYFLHSPLSANTVGGIGFPLSIGVNYRMNLNPQHTIRFDAGYDHIQFDDGVAQEAYRRNRGLNGSNNIYRVSAMFEYNFFGINNEQPRGLLSPYIFAGIGAMVHDVSRVRLYHDFQRDADGVALAPTHEADFVTTASFSKSQKVTPYIPLGVGVKYKFNHHWTVSLEATIRPTFTDQLDYNVLHTDDIRSEYNADIITPSSNASLLQAPQYYNVSLQREKDFLQIRQTGDLKGKDWVNSITLGVSYSFGRPPCYCD